MLSKLKTMRLFGLRWLLSLIALLPVAHSAWAADTKVDKPTEHAMRMVFFDINVDPRLRELVSERSSLTAALEEGLKAIPNLYVMDANTRNAMLLQKKIALSDCDKAECRFTLAKTVLHMDLLTEAEIKPFGDKGVCIIQMRVKNTKTQSVETSRNIRERCDIQVIFESIRRASASIWPPTDKGTLVLTSTPEGASVLLDGNGYKIKGVTPGKFMLKQGKYSLQLNKRGHATLQQEVSILPGETQELNLLLKAKKSFQGGRWIKLSAGLAVVLTGIIVDTAPRHSKDGKFSGADLAGVGLYAAGMGLVVWSFF